MLVPIIIPVDKNDILNTPIFGDELSPTWLWGGLIILGLFCLGCIGLMLGLHFKWF